MIFLNRYEGTKVLVTGHTGFKGSWLTAWLLDLGAKVTGFSGYLPSDPCNYEVLALGDKIDHIEGDVRDLDQLRAAFDKSRPDVVFHLAAQPLVRKSYEDPTLTFGTNVMGTANFLECLRIFKDVKAGIVITSDKCYKNVEWIWGYRENDALGGDDPYSASKGAAELIFNSYAKSYFFDKKMPNVASARAGNVIGGGDWAEDRIIPDCVKKFQKGEKLEIRSPMATRPWQHVLEPLSGYLWLGAQLLAEETMLGGEAFNFGPLADVNRTVEELLKDFIKRWGSGEYLVRKEETTFKKESNLLKLNCDKAMSTLHWSAVLDFEETMHMTADWYKQYYDGNEDMYSLSLKQIGKYIALARERGLEWAM